jgi:O-antigen/teichoic acid export membrane protein
VLPVTGFISRIMSIEPIRRQSLISLGNLIGLTVIGYIATMYFAHVLGPAVLGSYYLFLSYYGIFSLIGDGGFGGAAVKRISEGNQQEEYFSAFVLLRILLMTVSVTVLLFLSPYLKDLSSSGLIPWLILALVVGAFVCLPATGVYGTGKVGIAQISDFLNNVVKISVQIIATFLGYVAVGLAGGMVAGLLAGFVLNFYYLPLKLARFSFYHIKCLFAFSFWTFLSGSGLLVFTTADTILIGYYLSSTDVGIYRIPLQLTGAALFICMALNTTLFPKISLWNAEGDLLSISSALTRAFSFSLLLAIPVITGGILLCDKLLFFLYGSDFTAGTSSLIVLLLMQIATIFVTLQTTCLNAINQPKKSFISISFTASANILLNMILIPLFGILGAAYATLISVSMNALISYWFLSHYLQVTLDMGTLKNIIIAAGTMAVMVLILRLISGIPSIAYLLGAVVGGALIYFFVLFRLDVQIRKEASDLMGNVGLT